MTIHFICRGNVFRSRMAESYLNSLKIPSIFAISSGALAEQYAQENAHIEKDTLDFLKQRGLNDFAKQHYDQLTWDRVRQGDTTICMTPLVYEESQNVVPLPKTLSSGMWQMLMSWDQYQLVRLR